MPASRESAREELALQERVPSATGAAARGTTSSEALADRDKRAGADARGDADSQQALSAKRKLEAAPASATPAPDEFAALLARTPRSASAARALRLAWRAFAEAHPGDARADEARVRAIEAAALACEFSAEPGDRETLERDAAYYLERKDARQKPRVETLVRATLT